MITVTIESAPVVIVVDLSDHPAIRGIRLHGSLILNSLIDRCASVTTENVTVSGCSELGVPKEMIVDATEPFSCIPGDCSVAILAEGDNLHGTMYIEALENSVFLPFVKGVR